MREILFKAKDLEGKWVEGFYWASLDPTSFETKWRGHFIHNGVTIAKPIEIDPETLRQYIGKQIKKRKIFEGDIVFTEVEMDEGDVRMYFVVTWIEEQSRFALLNVDDEYFDYKNTMTFDDFILFHFNVDELTIEGVEKMHYAGNIWDNKELLKL